MIHQRLLALAVRRERLQVCARRERAAIGRHLARLSGPIGLLDRSIFGVRWLKRNPAVLAIGLIAAVALRPRGMLGVARGGLRLWAAWRALRAPRMRVAWAMLPRLLEYYQIWRTRRG